MVIVLKIHQSKSKGPNTNLAQILIGCVQRAPESDAQLSEGDTVLPSPLSSGDSGDGQGAGRAGLGRETATLPSSAGQRPSELREL